MKKYFDHMRSKSPHERRQHAMQVAGIITALVFVVWVSTLGVRFASTPPQTASNTDASQLANVVAAGDTGNATLIVATTTDNYSMPQGQ
jgi:hypothetical protein